MQTHAQSQVTHVQLHIQDLLYTRTRMAVQMGRDATRPQHARCTMQAIHDNTRRQDARSRRSSSNRRLTDASDSKSPSREREQSRCDSDGGALAARAVWQMPAQQSTQREARRERLPATRVDQVVRRALCSLADQEAAHRRAEISM